MKISVVIPAYNEEKYLAQCLKSVIAQNDKPDEIIVVDNNSTDTTAQIAASFPEVTLIHEKKQGITPTRNKGFNTAIGDIIARTDADTRVPKNWIKKIRQHFEEDPTLLALSGPARFDEIPKAMQPKNWLTVIGLNATFRQTFHHDVLFGPNLALRKSTWEKVKNDICMNDKVVHEDVDLALHVARLGKVFFDEKLVVISSPRRWKKLAPYFEYPYRYIRTVQHHKQSFQGLKRLKKSSDLVKEVFPRTRKLLKRLSDVTVNII